MSRAQEWKFLVTEIIDAAQRIEGKVRNHDFDSFMDDEDCQDIVERRLQILTEAAGRIPDEIQKKYPEIPWKKIKGMRNILAHEYYSVAKQSDRRILWDTVTASVPVFTKQLIALLKKEGN